MTHWKVFVPPHQELNKLLHIAPGELFINTKNNPVWESVYIRDKSGQWISLSWNYIDVEFKFEIYCLSIDSPKNIIFQDLIPAGSVPNFASLEFLMKSDWVRPTLPGEVPENFEQVIEEGGPISSVPSSASVVGTTIYGIVFNDVDHNPLLVIAVDDNERYSVKKIVDFDAIATLMEVCDSFSLPELMTWSPPVSHRGR